MSGPRKRLNMIGGLPALAKARLEQQHSANSVEVQAEIEAWRQRGDVLIVAKGFRIEVRRHHPQPTAGDQAAPPEVGDEP